MPVLTLIEFNGTEHLVKADVGQSVMQAANFANVPGLQADCGGACSCATCHAFVDEDWLARLPAAEDAESDMLEYACARSDNSRLTCQLIVSDALDGLLLRLPESQY